MTRGMNKKGETEQSAISGWVIGLILLIVVIGVIMLFFGPLKGYFSTLNDDLSKTVTTCNTVKSKLPDNGASYCRYESVSLTGKDEYINCVDDRITSKLDTENKNRFTCGNESILEVCKTILLAGKTSAVINGNSINCLDTNQVPGMSCAYLNGVKILDAATCASGTKSVVINSTSSVTEKCCITLA